MYCVKCGVELSDTESRCPLCQTEVLLPPGCERKKGEALYPAYPQAESEGMTKEGGLLLLTLILAIPLIVCLVCDWHINGRAEWSGYTTGGILLFYVLAVLPSWFRRPNPVVFLPCGMVAIALFLFYINEKNGGSWFLTLALPIVVAVTLILTAAVTLLRYTRGGECFIFGGAMVLFGAFMLLLEYLVNLTFGLPYLFRWSPYPTTALALVGLFLILVGIIRPLREALKKRFFF